MATELRVAFENKAISIPRNQALINQLHGLEQSVTSAGTVRYRHQEGKHDDYVWALALAFDGTCNRSSVPFEVVSCREPYHDPADEQRMPGRPFDDEEGEEEAEEGARGIEYTIPPEELERRQRQHEKELLEKGPEAETRRISRSFDEAERHRRRYGF